MAFFFETLFADIIILILSTIALSYIYFKYVYTYWSRKGVPYIEPTYPFGNVKQFALQQKSLGEVLKNIHNEFKKRNVPFGGFYAIGNPQLIIVDPELVKLITTKEFQYFHDRDHFVDEENDPLTTNLLAQKGIKWRNLRSKLTPAFTSGKMKHMLERFTTCSELMSLVIKKKVEKGEVIDIKDFLGRFTTDIIGSCAFGIECNSLTNPDDEFRKYGLRIFENSFRSFLIRFLSGTSMSLVKILKLRQSSPEVTKFFFDTVQQIVDYREKNNVERNDIMNLLIKLKNNETIDDGEKDDIIQSDHKKATGGLSMAEVTAQAFIFFFAGFETSSSTMTFCLFELACNQEIQDKLRLEIEDSLKKHDNVLNYDAIMDMHYLDKVIKETLRKYPVAPAINRLCVKDFKIPNTDVVIKKGTSIFVSTFGLHSDPEYYPDPIKFDPERFNEETKSSRHQYTYLPFGAGPRICIGMRFGLLQTKVGIISLLKNFKFTLDPKTKVPLQLDKKSVLLSSQDPILLCATYV